MKWLSTIFAILMFVVLFVAPITLTIVQEDVSIVFQEFEDSNDAEEGEDIKLKEAQEKLFLSADGAMSKLLKPSIDQMYIDRNRYIFTTQLVGVETPPPRFA